LFDIVLSLYAIPLDHPAFEPLRDALHQQWERTLAQHSDQPGRIDRPETARNVLDEKRRRLQALEIRQRAKVTIVLHILQMRSKICARKSKI
jgi:hypothetical protein